MGMIFIGVFTLLALAFILHSIRQNQRKSPMLAIGALLLVFQLIQAAYFALFAKMLLFPIDNFTLSSMLLISIWFMPNKLASLNRAKI